jgi:hypothetical protein
LSIPKKHYFCDESKDLTPTLPIYRDKFSEEEEVSSPPPSESPNFQDKGILIYDRKDNQFEKNKKIYLKTESNVKSKD